MSPRVRLALVILLVVSGLHVILTKMTDANVSNFWSAALFYLLFPGEVASMVLTGAHGGGTAIQNVLAAIFGILLNTCAWGLVFLLIGKVRQRLRRPA
jgi:hypothetical protein